MQPAATTVEPKKKSSKWLKGALYTAFTLALVSHVYNDYSNTQIREAQDALINAQNDLIEAQALEIDVLKEGGAESGGSCDDGFIIQDLQKKKPLLVKANPAKTPAKQMARRI